MSLSFYLLLTWGLRGYVSGETITRYQQDQIPVCRQNSVCTELSSLPGNNNFFSLMSCQCPNGNMCPVAPGEFTLTAGNGKWYGLCQPVSEIRECEQGEVSEEQFFGAKDRSFLQYTQVNCLCSGSRTNRGLMVPTTVWTRTRRDDPRADLVYEFTCPDEVIHFNNLNVNKRGRRGRARGGFRKFYFYK